MDAARNKITQDPLYKISTIHCGCSLWRASNSGPLFIKRVLFIKSH